MMRLAKSYPDPFGDSSKPNLMNSLKSAGVSFPKGGKAVFNEKDSELIVIATKSEMDQIDALVDKHGGQTGRQSRRPPKSEAERKLSSIVLPRVKFEEERLKDCVAYRVAEIKRHDPKKTGVAIELVEPKSEQLSKVTLDLTDIPAYQALRFTAELGGLKLKTSGKTATIAP